MSKGQQQEHRRFGGVRKLPSGRYQASYLGPDGRRRYAPNTFDRKSAADRFLALVEVQLMKGEWTDPKRAKVKLAAYAGMWIDQHARLRPRTIELYKRLLRKWIAPHIGQIAIGDLTTSIVREWRAKLLTEGATASQTAKAYRLLRAVLMTAADDQIIPRNPCRIRGAADEHPAERPVLSLPQVFELADLVGRHPDGNVRQIAKRRFRVRYRISDGSTCLLPKQFTSRSEADRALWLLAYEGSATYTHDRRYGALVLMTTFTSLRWGEAMALRRRDIDTKRCTVSVTRQFVELDDGSVQVGPPKSRAGTRTVAFPAAVLPAIKAHLKEFAGPDPDDLVFLGPNGGVPKRRNFRRASRWGEAVEAIGVPGLHFHDLRHTGNTLAARSKASLRDLMDRMGHDSVRAALIYQHAAKEAGQAIADAINLQIESQHGDGEDEPPDGLAPVA